MRSDRKTNVGGAFSLVGISLSLGLLAGCSQTGGATNTLAMQPTQPAMAPSLTEEVENSGEAAAAALPDQTNVFPTTPAYASSEAGASGESAQKLEQVAALDPAEAQGTQPVTTDYNQVLQGRASAVAFSSRDHECLARAMYFESNRSSREGMLAVGSVVMNRVQAGKWGSTVCQVVGSPKQFAPGVLTRSMDSAGGPLAMDTARSVLKGERHPRIYPDVMFFHTAGYRFNYDNMHYVAVAGGNSFYEKRRRMRGRANTPQSAIMAMASTPIRAAAVVAEPVKKVLKAPVKAAKKILPIAEEMEEAAAPIPVAAPVPRPAAEVQPDAARFGAVEPAKPASGKTGRVVRKPAPQL